MGVTEVPEHLLKRSQQRRAAMGGGGPAAEGDATSAAPSASPAPAAPAPPVGVAAPAPEAPAPAAPVVAAAPTPAVSAPAGPRSGIPVWMMRVLLVLPFWGIVYMGAFAPPKAAAGGPVNGAQVYVKAGCVSCHGPTGGGGVGPKLAGGEAKLTFPNEADHLAWVENGSASARGKSYGDPNRPGGARPNASGGMPAFKGQLTPEEITAVVQYERDRL